LSGPAVISAEEIAVNRARASELSYLAGGALSLVLGVIVGVGAGLGASVLVGAIAAVVVVVLGTLVVSGFIRSHARDRVLSLLGARAIDEDDEPRLANITEGLCATFGLKVPDLFVVDDGVPNACSLGEDPDHAAIVVTTGLLDTVGLLELEGVLAHELAHIKRHDTAVFGVAVMICGPLVKLTGSDSWLGRALGRGREYRADQVAVAAVRYPPELHDALVTLSHAPEPTRGSLFASSRWPATRWIWIDPMVGQHARHDLQGSLDATAVRIAALEEW
jgi:Zn-dependent protease with chaperone function